MLLVPTYLAISSTHGIGCFSKASIKRGEPMWALNASFDLVLTREQIDALAEPAREQVLKYSYLDMVTGMYVLCSDDARFYNHSEMPNTGFDFSGTYDRNYDVAYVDIEPDEEILCDYRTFDAESAAKSLYVADETPKNPS